MRIVLVRPRDPNNIGAVARAMANFGVPDLAVVAPHPPVWEEVRSAVGAGSVLERARVVASLREAISDRVLIAGTTAGTRRRLADVVGPRAFAAEVAERNAWAGAALVFGNEKHGLSNEDLARCNRVVRIEASVLQPSLNLAQAVAICCYEASRARGEGPTPPAVRPRRAESLARAGEVDALLDAVGATIASERGAGAGGRAAETLADLLRRARATSRDVAFLHGLLATRGRR
jgi:tRNA/rRNA methyltransferase